MVMAALGYTVNALTLLGLVLAIGLVVDDAIVVLENIYRRIEQGMPPLLAALEGSKEIGFAVVATTLVLVAVFVPLSFIEGDIGRLFSEFGITLAAAVIFSSFVALTLSPMMCSKLFRQGEGPSGFVERMNEVFRRLTDRYRRLLERVVARPGYTIAAAGLVLALAVVLMRILPSEYAPQEDRGVFSIVMRAPEGASLAYTDRYARDMERILMAAIDDGPVMRILTRVPARFGASGEVNSARAIVLLDPWSERGERDQEVATHMGAQLAKLPGVRFAIFTSQSLGIRSEGRPVRLVLGGPDYPQLEAWRDAMLTEMEAMPELVRPDSDYQERKPQLTVRVDRDRASALGVSLAAVGRTLETMLGSRIVTTYVDRGREYNVILQGEDADRASPDDLRNLYVRSDRGGGLVPLSNLVRLEEKAGPDQLARFDRMRAITLDAALAEGVSLGEALDGIEARVREVLPASARVGWDGESREYFESGSALYWTFGLALLIVFLVLAGQFESFVHPLVILSTVPLALTGGLLGLLLYSGTLNVFSQIGAILLIGLSAKNGVLIVEFANQLRDRPGPDGRPARFEEALVEAAAIRLRPILMTSACTTFGAVPLLLATGAGAESRQPIGIAVVFGVTFSALLTLFVVPAFYAVLARNTRSPHYVARAIARLRSAGGAPGVTSERVLEP
jgi:multidrug efflux pump